MKKYLFLIAFVATCAISCVNVNSGLNIVSLRKAGKELPGEVKYDASNCKPDGSKQTLESIRYVDKLPIYYMDYYAQVDWSKLEKAPSERYAPAVTTPVANDLNNLLYKNSPAPNQVSPKSSGACSGFVCFNQQNELLFGRNYDGSDSDPLVIVFNKAVNEEFKYKSVMMTGLETAQVMCGNPTEYTDRTLLSSPRDLGALLRQPIAIMDGMNEVGLCLAAYQLPHFCEQPNDDAGHSTITKRPSCIDIQRGETQITGATLHNRILSTCKTVSDVVAVFEEFDLTSVAPTFNIHWFVADAENHYLTIEIWQREDGEYAIHAMDEEDRWFNSYVPSVPVPYEYRSIENYYVNPDVSGTFTSDYWQYRYTNKTRVHNMMSHYTPVMNEEEALRCLQYGNYSIEMIGKLTNWSCVYNPQKRTVLFNMRNDLSTVYSIDLTEDLK